MKSLSDMSIEELKESRIIALDGTGFFFDQSQKLFKEYQQADDEGEYEKADDFWKQFEFMGKRREKESKRYKAIIIEERNRKIEKTK